MARLMWLCERLDAVRILHEVKKVRDDVISIHAAVPGERWEIDIDCDGKISIERFKTTGEVSGIDKFDALLKAQNADAFQ